MVLVLEQNGLCARARADVARSRTHACSCVQSDVRETDVMGLKIRQIYNKVVTVTNQWHGLSTVLCRFPS